MAELTETSPESPKPRRRWLGRLILLALLAGGVIWGASFVHHLLTTEETDDAYVTGSIHTISSRLAGVVEMVLVEENTSVKAGQPIVKLDTRDLDLRLSEARVALEQARAKLAEADARVADSEAQDDLVKAGIELAKANVARDEAQNGKAKADFARAETLWKQNGQSSAISRADYESARTILSTAEATLTATHASLEAAKAYVASTAAKKQSAAAERTAAAAAVQTAELAVQDAELQLSYATVTAPTDGLVSRRNVEVGNRIQPGQALFALVEPKVWIVANFKETQVHRLRLGQKVDIAIDAVPGQTLAGQIESFSPASGSQFALLPPDNATGNFTKVVQRLPVKIQLTSDSLQSAADRLRPGLSAIVTVPLGKM